MDGEEDQETNHKQAYRYDVCFHATAEFCFYATAELEFPHYHIVRGVLITLKTLFMFDGGVGQMGVLRVPSIMVQREWPFHSIINVFVRKDFVRKDVSFHSASV